MPKPFNPSDLLQHSPCDRCSAPLKLHGAPFGEPAFILMLGYCHRCAVSQLTVRLNDQVQYTQSPLVQLAGMFLQLAQADGPPAANSPL